MKLKHLRVLVLLLLLLLCAKDDIKDDFYEPGDEWIETFVIKY